MEDVEREERHVSMEQGVEIQTFVKLPVPLPKTILVKSLMQPLRNGLEVYPPMDHSGLLLVSLYHPMHLTTLSPRMKDPKSMKVMIVEIGQIPISNFEEIEQFLLHPAIRMNLSITQAIIQISSLVSQ